MIVKNIKEKRKNICAERENCYGYTENQLIEKSAG